MGNWRRVGYAFQSIVWDEETEESRGVILASGGDIGVHVLVAGDDCLVVRGGDFMNEVSKDVAKLVEVYAMAYAPGLLAQCFSCACLKTLLACKKSNTVAKISVVSSPMTMLLTSTRALQK